MSLLCPFYVCKVTALCLLDVAPFGMAAIEVSCWDSTIILKRKTLLNYPSNTKVGIKITQAMFYFFLILFSRI